MSDLPELQWTKAVLCVVIAVLVTEVLALNGPNVCMVKQKYNITKLIKYRAPMSIRTYEWCFAIPPRCSKWNTEMKDLTRLETEERTAEVAVCCPGYKMRDVSCVPICPNGKMGAGCSEDCPKNKWGPNCVNDCKPCDHGSCSPINGECRCEDGWQGESCESSMPTTTIEDILTTTKTTPTTITTSTKPTTASVGITTKTQVATSTTSTTSKTITFKSTTEVIPFTEKNLTKESFASIEIKIATPITKKHGEKSLKTEESFTTTARAVTVGNAMIENKKRTGKEVVTVNWERIIDATTISGFTQIPEKNYVNANHTISYRDLLSTQNSVNVKEDSTTIVPIIHEDLLKTNSLENNVIEATTLFAINRNVTPEGTAKVVEPRTEEETPMEITTVTDDNGVRSTEVLTTTENVVNFTKSRENTIKTSTATEQPIIITTTESPVIQTTQKIEPMIYSEATTRIPTTTIKFKPKEIWIKPAQKGDSIELKNKINHELQRYKSTNKELSINTTPKTIIVSIIPTSVSYATFKKIALTTTAYIFSKVNTSTNNSNKTEQGFTKPMPTYLTTTSSTTEISTISSLNTTLSQSKMPTTLVLSINDNTTSSVPTSAITLKSIKTNSMATNAVTSNNLTVSTNTTTKILSTTTPKTIERYKTTKPVKNYHWITAKESFKTNKTASKKLEALKNKTITMEATTNNNKILTNDRISTEMPADEETFHILTEPEHITAVMGDKESDRTSMDLKSVISIAGGVMMAVITVAVIIVMIERCRRPRYEDVRKINDIRMQVMIDGNDVPPPYVRSIFHTPLPEPPMVDKCHYQPISTLDRNLKQFMRPVVVQTISPIMLENFRGILECHYDHLPRRSRDFQPIPVRCSVAPSLDCCELSPLHDHSVTDHDINAMKCEAKLDEIDNTTAEPLYAEIPCWRPPSEHAVEILNLNGEAVTEL